MSLQTACIESLKILKQVMEAKLNASNVELCTITPEANFKMIDEDTLDTLILEVEKKVDEK